MYNLNLVAINAAFAERARLERHILSTASFLKARGTVATTISWSYCVNHLEQPLPAEEVLIRLRKHVGASTQPKTTTPRVFLHEIRDCESIGHRTLHERFLRSLLVNSLRRMTPSNDYVGLIVDMELDIVWFANCVPNGDAHEIQIKAIACPHVEPDWRLDDFVRREVHLYEHDMYGDHGRMSLSQFLDFNELNDLTYNELREYAYRKGIYASLDEWLTLEQDDLYLRLYDQTVQYKPRLLMSQADRLELLRHRVALHQVEPAEAFYWMQILGIPYAEALSNSKLSMYNSLLVSDLNQVLDDE
ncbi:hypothetical protein YOLOSWAG_285 [Erwinia phage vB_EamM_Yoloswag]|uniref:Uncharacterized protein n=1 Tax=Erwinia phage vB_EamM_Yoloswag TaxID=1958956 RepID=A0A1S6L3K4_9CAUD|nr:hypothetical protein HOR66_gp285 [Erwinia phage vB_EamM_Yoloswag]AQT28756.1 hypothetical protein YOLOSWAG_285 [Erwinia phage vB_EamM_Yoloswag]